MFNLPVEWMRHRCLFLFTWCKLKIKQDDEPDKIFLISNEALVKITLIQHGKSLINYAKYIYKPSLHNKLQRCFIWLAFKSPCIERNYFSSSSNYGCQGRIDPLSSDRDLDRPSFSPSLLQGKICKSRIGEILLLYSLPGYAFVFLADVRLMRRFPRSVLLF